MLEGFEFYRARRTVTYSNETSSSPSSSLHLRRKYYEMHRHSAKQLFPVNFFH